jgi:phosphatidylcholine synthase
MAESKETLLRVCAWLIHLYTAAGVVVAFFAIEDVARGDFQGAFLLMAAAVFIDSTDGPLARAARVRERAPIFDGATLDNIVDYLNYVAVPVFLMHRAHLLATNDIGWWVAALVLIASAYAFCRTDAKTGDGYFRGFPSYWNLVALYLYCLDWPHALNTVVIFVLAVMEFAPLKFIYPNRTAPLRSLTLGLAIIWGVITVAMLFQLPRVNPILLYTSLTFIVYYFLMSFALQAASAFEKETSEMSISR